MPMIKEGIELVKRFEGLCLTAYKCAAGVWTIGYGHTGKVNGVTIKQGMKITTATAEKLLTEDLTNFYNTVNLQSYVPLIAVMDEYQKAALTSFAFNCGSNNLKTLCKSRNLEQIADALLLYNKAAGKTLKGLTERREAERKLFMTNMGKINLPTVRKGSKGSAVEMIQSIVGASVDGDFGTKTETAVKKFQKERNIVDDGVVGSATWAEAIKAIKK